MATCHLHRFLLRPRAPLPSPLGRSNIIPTAFGLTFPPQGRQNGAAGSGTLSPKGLSWIGGVCNDPRAFPPSAVQQARRLGLRAPGERRVAAPLHNLVAGSSRALMSTLLELHVSDSVSLVFCPYNVGAVSR